MTPKEIENTYMKTNSTPMVCMSVLNMRTA